MNDVKLWLEDDTYYYKGVELYEKHFPGSFLVQLFWMGEDAYNRTKLHEELSKLVEAQEEQREEQQSNYPTELLTELEKAQSLMDERADLKAQLRRSWRNGESAKEREAMTLRVLAIKEDLDHIYATERYFNKMKALPKDDFDTEDQIAGLMKRLNTVRTYVSRYRNKPESEKFQQYNDELFQITEKLRVLGVTFQD